MNVFLTILISLISATVITYCIDITTHLWHSEQ